MKRGFWWWAGMVLATPAMAVSLVVLLIAVAELFV